MKKLLFVVNGHSGKGQIKNKLLDIIDIMIKEGYHVQVHTTQEREDATKVVREQAKYYDLVVCSGGDGTLDEAVTGMMQSEVRTPLGYIPAGSTNDFANSLEIPKDMIQAAKTAVLGVPFSCDVGEFNDWCQTVLVAVICILSRICGFVLRCIACFRLCTICAVFRSCIIACLSICCIVCFVLRIFCHDFSLLFIAQIVSLNFVQLFTYVHCF